MFQSDDEVITLYNSRGLVVVGAVYRNDINLFANCFARREPLYGLHSARFIRPPSALYGRSAYNHVASCVKRTRFTITYQHRFLLDFCNT
jgi:hypothetical protein